VIKNAFKIHFLGESLNSEREVLCAGLYFNGMRSPRTVRYADVAISVEVCSFTVRQIVGIRFFVV
jgi:hypothetical protein